MKRIFFNEVVTRDGFQMEPQFIPTDSKVALIDELSACGYAKIEATSFTSAKAIPMLRDAEEVMGRIRRVPGVEYTVLVPNVRGAERALDAQHHQDIPFEQVVELLDPVRSLSHTPVFQVTFVWQNTPGGGGLSLPGLELGGAGAGGGGPAQVQSKFDLSLSLSERNGRIGGSVTYATALFDRETVERFAGYLRRALEEMAADDARPVERLALLSASERALVLEEWDHAVARGAPILAELAGYGTSSDHTHRVRPQPEGQVRAALHAVHRAVWDAPGNFTRDGFRQSYVEGSGANPMLELTRLISASRAFMQPVTPISTPCSRALLKPPR